MKEDSGTLVLKRDDAPDITIGVADYLEVLASDVRLKILRLVQNEPMDIRIISRQLLRKYGKSMARENAKKHVDKLLKVGLLKRQSGERDNRTVWKYSLVPGSYEGILRNLHDLYEDPKLESFKITEVQQKVTEALTSPIIRILGGPDDGREFLLKSTESRIGRIEPMQHEGCNQESDLALSECKDYKTVSRIWKPHGKMYKKNGNWYYEHCKGQNRDQLFGWTSHPLEKEGDRVRLKNGDMIDLGVGEDKKGIRRGIRLLFLLSEQEEHKE